MLQKLLGCLNYIHERAISPLLGCGMGCASRACGRACVCSRARVRMGACACACARAGARARAHVCACVRASCVRGSFLRVKQNVLVVRISEIIFRWGGAGICEENFIKLGIAQTLRRLYVRYVTMYETSNGRWKQCVTFWWCITGRAQAHAGAGRIVASATGRGCVKSQSVSFRVRWCSLSFAEAWNGSGSKHFDK